ncbi:MAG TPA: 50S ribosomal protein L6 [Thermodesulfobacteriota bacterium]|jgi:large subunit ribosomal protein L6
MSRIGRRPIILPAGVKVNVNDGLIEVSGPKGKLLGRIPQGIQLKAGANQVSVERKSDEKEFRALHGLARSLLANMVLGVTEGFSKSLDIIGVGYKAELIGKATLKFSLGYSNPVEFSLPEEVSARVEERGTRVIIQGIDKEAVGETAARIKRLRFPDSYKGKGIRYKDEILKLKPGKAGTKK